jgi:hypothetical protein
MPQLKFKDTKQKFIYLGASVGLYLIIGFAFISILDPKDNSFSKILIIIFTAIFIARGANSTVEDIMKIERTR